MVTLEAIQIYQLPKSLLILFFLSFVFKELGKVGQNSFFLILGHLNFQFPHTHTMVFIF